MTAKEALQQAREALDLKWTSNADRDTLAGIVDQLVEELATPLSTLQTVQLLWLPGEASSRHKPVGRRVLDKLSDVVPLLADSNQCVAWAQVLAWSALRVGLDSDKDGITAIFIALMRSGAEWCSSDKRRETLWKALLTKAEVACRLPIPSVHVSYKAFSGWPNAEFETVDDSQYPTVKTALDGWGNAPQNIVNAVATLNSAVSSEIDSTREAAAEVIGHIEKHLMQHLAAPTYVTEPLETLWWGQSLYSPSLHESYRDLNTAEKLFWMAEDMAQLANIHPSEARTAFFTETLRRVDESIDKQATIEAHARNLIQGVQAGMKREPNAAINGVPQQLHEAFEKDPTGLPITFIVEGALRKTSDDAILSDLQSKTGVDIARSVSTRQWARWVCRERLLIRFLHDQVKE